MEHDNDFGVYFLDQQDNLSKSFLNFLNSKPLQGGVWVREEGCI